MKVSERPCDEIEELREEIRLLEKEIDEIESRIEDLEGRLYDCEDRESRVEYAEELASEEWNLEHVFMEITTLEQKLEKLEMDEQTNTTFKGCLESAADELRDTVLKKSEAYGDLEPPELCPQMSVDESLLVRLSDKFRRLRNLRTQPIENVFESFDDTIQDIAGYCLLYRANQKFRNGVQK